MIPLYGDNSEAAQATRMAAIKANACPFCHADKGFDCITMLGKIFPAKRFVHQTRLKLNDEGLISPASPDR